MPKQSPHADRALAAALRNLREQTGRSQEDVAIRAGMTGGTLARIELGQTSPEWRTVRAIADELKVSLSDLAAAVEAAERR